MNVAKNPENCKEFQQLTAVPLIFLQWNELNNVGGVIYSPLIMKFNLPRLGLFSLDASLSKTINNG